MALSPMANTIVKGAIGAFEDAMSAAPEIWRKYTQVISSSTKTETHAFTGHVPEPREHMGEREIRVVRDYSFTLENKGYEVTIAIPRDDFNDQQVQKITTRFAEIGRVYGNYKDVQMKDLLENNAAPPINDADEVTAATFFETADALIIGGSGGLTNDLTTNVATPGVLTTSEAKTVITNGIAQLKTMKDDQGRTGFNDDALSDCRVLCPTNVEWNIREAIEATVISQTTNVLKGICEMDVMTQLSAAAADAASAYTAACGNPTSRPFIMQEREGLEIIIDTDPARVAKRNAVLVMCRERYRFEFGDPRRMIRDITD